MMTFMSESELSDIVEKSYSVEELNVQLSEALENEDYEAASKIRDEINRRNSN